MERYGLDLNVTGKGDFEGSSKHSLGLHNMMGHL
jgi:hypothetical protein